MNHSRQHPHTTPQKHLDARARRRTCPRPAFAVAVALATMIAASGCGSTGSSITAPRIAPAKTYELSGFQPAGPVVAGRPTTVSFTIREPSGEPLTNYRTCCEPHEGVDLIIVRSDDSHIQYDDSDIAADGKVTQPVIFPAPGSYRVVIDAYPKQTQPNAPINFQLFTRITVKGHYHAEPLPAYNPTQTVDGYRFQIQGHPRLKAIEAEFLTINVRDPAGRKPALESWRGALAHAIFIHQGSLDYFHTHVCSPGSRYCTSALGATKVTGSSSAPGQLKVGVLLPEPGTWRLFLLTYIHGKHLTPTFTLHVSS
jgi:hypothetical protein